MISAEQVLELRLAERDEEFRHRLLEFELAAEGIRPPGVSPHVPASGAGAFVDLLSNLDEDQIHEILDAAKRVHTDGYAIVPGLLAPAEIELLQTGMAHLFADTERLFGDNVANILGDRQTVHIQNVLAKTDAADATAAKPYLRALVSALLGHDFILNAGAVAMSPDPGCNPQGLHRDDGFYGLIPRPHLPLVMTVAIALDDFTAANGGTQLVPGSSRWPESRQADPDTVIQAEMLAGAMLVWDGALLHGGGGNRTTEQSRRTLTLNYTRGWLRTQFNQYLSVPRERVLAMPAALQADLGYHTSALGLGRCDGQEALKYLRRLTAAGGDGQQATLGKERDDTATGSSNAS